MSQAWYSAARDRFLEANGEGVVAGLASAATSTGWHIPEEQHREWILSVDQLQAGLRPGADSSLKLLQDALRHDDMAEFTHVALEYDLRRRGLRIDGLLFAPGLIVLVEFKRSRLVAADRDQVLHYAMSLLEFHELTIDLCRSHKAVIVPILALTEGKLPEPRLSTADWHPEPWEALPRRPLQCDRDSLRAALHAALAARRSRVPVDGRRWVESRFSPSTTIVDAAIAMYGRHDVSAIRTHAIAASQIRACTRSVVAAIEEAGRAGRRRIILISGAPGAGKTLVGLDIAFEPSLRGQTVFVTGNAPLVDVLRASLRDAYQRHRERSPAGLPPGYALASSQAFLSKATSFPISKAHEFLRHGSSPSQSADGRIVIFDEAQRTYEKGKQVLGHALEDHEADLVLAALEKAHGQRPVVVALLGQNQAINVKERGGVAWLEAAERRDWDVSVADATLDLFDTNLAQAWRAHALRRPLADGHLATSMRFYRNSHLEQWAHALLAEDQAAARTLAGKLDKEDHTVWLTRSLADAKQWVRERRLGEDRAGMVGSAQGRRLSAEGLFVELKPPIDDWMLKPSSDPRSSNMLETVQNQYQIQGLELDYAIVCWDLDLRREAEGWSSYKMSGPRWRKDKELDVAKNGYRVLLTRARKGMVVFVPRGDVSVEAEDVETRDPRCYDAIAEYLLAAGARVLQAPTGG